MATVETLGREVGVKPACEALGLPRARRDTPPWVTPRPRPPLALTPEERATALEVLNTERFVDQAPPAIYATLLDEGVYYCSVRTLYRILAQEDAVRERRNVRRHLDYHKPELLATGPNQLWSWDITKLKGPQTWTYCYLYVILDVYSRYVVGWLMAERALAEQLIAETCRKQDITPDRLTLHADRGNAMTSKKVALLLADLGIIKSHSRPYVSDDNPYSEAQFKTTLEYRPDFPQRFGSL